MKTVHNSIKNNLILIIALILISQFSVSCLNISNKNLKSLSTTQASCSNKVMNFNGKCLSDLMNLDSLNIPNAAKSFLVPILKKGVTSKLDMCVGDFKGTQIEEMGNMGEFKCQGIPLPADGTYGVLGAYVNNVPCGSPVTVAACVVFDDCGSVAIAVNGGTATCAATYSTGIAAVISPLADILDSISIGFSLTRRYTKTFTVSARDGDVINSRQITTRGHFYFGLDIAMPFDFKIAGKTLKDFIEISRSTKFMVDFGHVGTAVKDFVTSLSDGKPDKNTIYSIMNLGAEMTVSVDSKMTLKFEDITKGLFDDLELNIGTVDVLITKGGDSASGLPLGIYVYFSSDILKNLFDLFDKLCDDMGPILNKIGFQKISFPKTNSSLGVFISNEATGFDFRLPGLYVKCMFLYSQNKGSCQFGSKLFTALINGAKWVVKKAAKFFDDTGEDIVEFANDAGKFSKKVAVAVAKKTEELARQAAEAAEKAKKEAEEAARKAKEAAEKAAREAKEAAEKAAREAKEAAEKAAKKAAEEAKNVANKAKKALSKW
jgi:hypothetical protein